MDLPPAIESNTSPIAESSIVEVASFKSAGLNATGSTNQLDLGNVCPEGDATERKVVLTCGLSEGSDTIVSHRVTSSQSNIPSETSTRAATSFNLPGNQKASVRAGNWQFFGASVNQDIQADNKADDVVEKIDSGQLWVVNSRRRNGLIVVREFHAEFAGPGAAVGGSLDEDIVKVIPIGN